MAQERGLVDLLEIYHGRSLFNQLDVQIRRLVEQKGRPHLHDPDQVSEVLNHYRELRHQTLQLLRVLGDTHALRAGNVGF